MMFTWIKSFFEKSKIDPDLLDVEKVMEVACSHKFYVSNGRSFYSSGGDPDLYENNYLKVGIGEIVSGPGDWGGGFSHSASSPMIVTINLDMEVINIKFDDFYNSNPSKEIRKKVEDIFGRYEFKKLHINPNSNLGRIIKDAFENPKSEPIGIGMYEYKLEDVVNVKG